MSEITYGYTADGIDDAELSGFFVGWPQPPSCESRLRILQAAGEVVIARDTNGSLVEFYEKLGGRRLNGIAWRDYARLAILA